MYSGKWSERSISKRCKSQREQSQVRGAVGSISDSKVYNFFSLWPSCHPIPNKERELGGVRDKIRGAHFRGLLRADLHGTNNCPPRLVICDTI